MVIRRKARALLALVQFSNLTEANVHGLFAVAYFLGLPLRLWSRKSSLFVFTSKEMGWMG